MIHQAGILDSGLLLATPGGYPFRRTPSPGNRAPLPQATNQHLKSSSHEPNRQQRLQVFDQIMGLLVIQTQPEKAVVVLDHIIERCKASVMEETTLRVGPEALEGSGAVALVRRTVGLKIVDSDLFSRVHIPPRLA